MLRSLFYLNAGHTVHDQVQEKE